MYGTPSVYFQAFILTIAVCFLIIVIGGLLFVFIQAVLCNPLCLVIPPILAMIYIVVLGYVKKEEAKRKEAIVAFQDILKTPVDAPSAD